jgi:hypothetical protein
MPAAEIGDQKSEIRFHDTRPSRASPAYPASTLDWARRLQLQASGILALKGDCERMQVRSHQSCDNRWIVLHKYASSRLIAGFKHGNAECLVTRLLSPARQDEFTRFDRVLESSEMPIKDRLVLVRPCRVGVQSRHEMQHVDKLPGLFARFRSLSR